LEQGQHIGYRRMQRGGVWYARFYSGAGKYAYNTLGNADDTNDADGLAVLNYAQAQEAARKWFAEQARIAEGLEANSGPYTVAEAISDYLAWYKAHRRGFKATTLKAEAHILPALGGVLVSKLTSKRIADWLAGLAAAPARIRTRKGRKQATRPMPTSPEAQRKRKATANRVLTVLKAALNHAWREGRVASDDAWRRVKPFHNGDAPVVRYLSQAECIRLLNTATPETRPMLRAAMLTGCRYSELAALTVADINLDAGTLAIRHSKSGKSRHVVLTSEAQDFFAKQIAGKPSVALVLTHTDGTAWGRNHLQRPLLEACKRAKIIPAISFHVLRHTHGSLLAMQGVPLQVIANQLGHSDTRMTERHYAHLSPSYMADTIRAHFPNLGADLEKTNVSFIASGYKKS
jgi:integrase